ncbi:MAG: permease, partial [Planctomycetota bacterium]|nr:permease [Planctomycetota bacterium]
MAWLAEIWSLLCESGPYLLVGFFLAGLLKVLVPERWILRHLGSNSFGAVAKAALLGAPLPLCSCSVVPTAIALKQAGASKGATSAFLISTPETGVDSVGITLALIDPVMAIMRPVTAILTAMGCGWMVNLSEPKSSEPAVDEESPEAPETCCSPSEP